MNETSDYATDMALNAAAYGVADQKVGAKEIRRMAGSLKQTHTPGPWILADEYNSLARHDYHFIDAGRGYPDDNGHGFGISGIMSLANARLIVAAPELLAALTNVVNDYADKIRGDEPPCLIEARAAIAAAREA